MVTVGAAVRAGHPLTHQNGPHGEAALAVAFTADLDSTPDATTPIGGVAAPVSDGPDAVTPPGQGLNGADASAGEALANSPAKNLDRLGMGYAVYPQRISFGNRCEEIEDRGGVTANHLDQVHVSFE